MERPDRQQNSIDGGAEHECTALGCFAALAPRGAAPFIAEQSDERNPQFTTRAPRWKRPVGTAFGIQLGIFMKTGE
jgi:hypothetical protein